MYDDGEGKKAIIGLHLIKLIQFRIKCRVGKTGLMFFVQTAAQPLLMQIDRRQPSTEWFVLQCDVNSQVTASIWILNKTSFPVFGYLIAGNDVLTSRVPT